MFRTFRYPLLAKPDQISQLEKLRIKCCELYNAALQERRDAWQKQRVSVTFKDQSLSLTEIRSAHPEWADVYRRSCALALKRLDTAFRSFFSRKSRGEKAGLPRFKSLDRYDSIGIGRPEVLGDQVFLPKIGWSRFKKYRPIQGEVRNVNLWRDHRGRWFVCFQCDVGAAPAKVAVRSVVGIDLGITNLVVLSDGTGVANPKHWEASEELLKRRQRVMAGKKRNSRGRSRAKRILASTHAQIRNRRHDHVNKLAAQLVADYDLICHEQLNIPGLAQTFMSKSVNNVAWGRLLRRLASKAEEAGKHVVAVDPRGTSQRCSSCQQVVRKSLATRTHSCPNCGLSLDRDVNAAKNILALGMSAASGISPPEAIWHYPTSI